MNAIDGVSLILVVGLGMQNLSDYVSAACHRSSATTRPWRATFSTRLLSVTACAATSAPSK
jgi:hypothetical protein